jgi:hypothetical protein
MIKFTYKKRSRGVGIWGGGGLGTCTVKTYNVCSYKKYVYASWKIYIVKTSVMKVVDHCFHSISSLLYA